MTLKQFVLSMLSEDGKDISFSRCACMFLLLYFAVQDAWLFHRTGHLLDNATSATQLGWFSTLYGLNKAAAVLGKS